MAFISSKKNLFYLFFVCFLSSCWAPRCPRRSCHVTLEHKHEDPTGIYRGRWMLIPPRIHLIWDKNKSDQNAMKQAGEKQRSAEPKQKKQPKRLFEWERN